MDAQTSALFKELRLDVTVHPKLAALPFAALSTLSDEDLAETYGIVDAGLRYAVLEGIALGPGSIRKSSVTSRRESAARAPAPLPALSIVPSDAVGAPADAGPAAPAVGDLAAVARRSGWLCKQGNKIKSWKLRWFVLDATSLYYFTTPQAKQPKGTIVLDGYTAEVDNNSKKKFAFKLSHPTQREWFFTCNDRTTMERWLQAIQIVATKGVLPALTTDHPDAEDEDVYAAVIDDRTNFDNVARLSAASRSPGRINVEAAALPPLPPPADLPTTYVTATKEAQESSNPPVQSHDRGEELAFNREECTFLHEGCSRVDAEVLVPAENGAYLVRRKSKADLCVISGYWDGMHRHFKIYAEPGLGFFVFRPDGLFRTAVKLLEHYATHNLPNAIEGSPRVLKRPIHQHGRV